MSVDYTLLPPLSTEEQEALRAGIAVEGVLVPIVIDQEGDVIDGHYRKQFAEELGMSIPMRTFIGTVAEGKAYAFQCNFSRRNLSPTQKTEALKAMKKVALELKKEDASRTQEQIAALFGVAQRTVSNWLKDHATPNSNIAIRCKPVPDSRVKVSPAARPVISARVEAGETQAQVAADYGVTQQQVSRIITATIGEKSAEDVQRVDSKFNLTTERIEWAKWTWNPITGCLGPDGKGCCDYCYARDIANRYWKGDFSPRFHEERLAAPANTPLPKNNDPGSRNVFVCSMADLFGGWVPQEWVDAVLDIVRNSPQWTFIFLTKNPSRVADFGFPDNAWVGVTVDVQARVAITEVAFAKMAAAVRFVSCEPLLEAVAFNDLSSCDWVILGGRSQTSTGPAVQPKWEWVESLMRQARDAGCKIYFKPNLTVVPKEFPGSRAS